MTAVVFVDTNVLVYARDASEPEKQPRAEAWMRALWTQRAGRLSVQILQEFYVTVTRKLAPGLPAHAAREDIRSLQAWRPLAMDGVVLEAGFTHEDRFGFSWWDSLVVAAAHATGSTHLLSEDLQAGQDLGGVVVVDPFRTEPREVLSR